MIVADFRKNNFGAFLLKEHVFFLLKVRSDELYCLFLSVGLLQFKKEHKLLYQYQFAG